MADEADVQAAWLAVEKKYLQIWRAVERVERLSDEYDALVEALHTAQERAGLPTGQPAHRRFRVSPSTAEVLAEGEQRAAQVMADLLHSPSPLRPRLRSIRDSE